MVGSHILRNLQYCGWLVGHGRRSGPGTGGIPPGQNKKTIGPKKYFFDKLIAARKTNSVMVMIIIHIACISCLVTNNAPHAYHVIVVYKILHGARRI